MPFCMVSENELGRVFPECSVSWVKFLNNVQISVPFQAFKNVLVLSSIERQALKYTSVIMNMLFLPLLLSVFDSCTLKLCFQVHTRWIIMS